MAAKTLLITGGNTGLGLEVVKALYNSATTYHIFLAGRNIEKAKTAINEVIEKGQGPTTSTKIEPLQLDVESDSSISAAFELVKSRIDHLDVLINNAGKYHSKETFLDSV